jgi:hypothetical protein
MVEDKIDRMKERKCDLLLQSDENKEDLSSGEVSITFCHSIHYGTQPMASVIFLPKNW